MRAGLVEPYLEAIFWEQAAPSRRRPAARRLARLERRQNELDAYRDNARLVTTVGRDSFERAFASGFAVLTTHALTCLASG